MKAFSNILVPVDFSDLNRTALARAAEIAGPAKGRITLLHVIEEIPYAEAEEQIDAFYAMLRRRAEGKMLSLTKAFVDGEHSVEFTTEIIIGRRGPEIVRFAVENDIDLVVMSSHAVLPTDHAASWATLSYQVSIVCPCSVLLVK